MATLKVLVGALLIAASCVVAADPPPAKRPKIGIALEGGGALGLGHIGVLEWLEANHIPIDYIAGTSMGGLVGGLYASGKSTAEIRTLIREVDWNEVLRGQVPYRDLTFRRKEDKRAYPNNIELGLKNGISVPSGLNSGQQVTYILDRAALPYSGLKSFDDLPIPFRCVATEMNTGTARVFKDGSLADALRATMSLPAIFTPAKSSEGKVYTDGGLLNNLPVDVVKAMGADIVIAVYLATAPFDPTKSQSLFTVLGQSISIMIAANERRNMEMADILITVDLAGFTALDYTAGDKIADKGTEGAEKKRRMLSTLAVDLPAWQQYQADKEKRRIQAIPTPQFIAVQGTTPVLSRDLETSLRPYIGKPLDIDKLEESLTRIAGQGRFSALNYQFAERQGKNGLVITAEEKSYAPPVLKPGILIDGSDYNNVRFGIGGRITFQDFGGFRSEWRTDLNVGSTFSLASEYYHPFTKQSQWFVAPKILVTNGPVDFYQSSRRLAEYRLRQAGGGADIGYLVNRSSEIRFGYSAGYRSAGLRIGAPELPTVSGRYGATSVTYSFDGLDSALVPRSGAFLGTAFQFFDTAPGTAGRFPSMQLDSGIFGRVSTPGSVFFGAAGGTTFGHNETGLPQFFLGGPLRLGSYGVNEILTNQYFLLRAGYLHEIGQLNPLLGEKIYALGFLEAAKIYGGTQKLNIPMDANAGVVVSTFIGPVFLGGSYGDRGHRKIYFKVGRVF